MEQERAFAVVKIVALGKMDYENFITDLLADRVFLDGLDTICRTGSLWHCVLVCRKGHKDGVLVVPRGGYVEWAAYIVGRLPGLALRDYRKDSLTV